MPLPNAVRRKLVVALAALLTILPTATRAERDRGPLGAIGKIIKAVAGQTREVDQAAMEVYRGAPRSGSCAERRQRILAALPDVLRFARYANEIGERSQEAKMKADHLDTLDLGNGRTAYYHAKGRRYAEVQVDQEHRQVVVVFLGTRLSVGADVRTDVLSFIGLQTGYYRWASALVGKVAAEHQGLEVVATGHSLAGGLALYSVLKNPGVKAYAFNPSGLAVITWVRARAADRARTNTASTVVSLRNAGHIEPVTALSFAGRSILPGQILVVETDETNPAKLHESKTVVAALEQLAATQAAGDACEGEIGELAD
jgi:hypothetical protein